MKDARGHGNNSRGSAQTPVQSENAPFVSRFAGKGVNYLEPNDPRGAGARAQPSDQQAAGALAQGGAKSAAVPVHPGATGRSRSYYSPGAARTIHTVE